MDGIFFKLQQEQVYSFVPMRKTKTWEAEIFPLSLGNKSLDVNLENIIMHSINIHHCASVDANTGYACKNLHFQDNPIYRNSGPRLQEPTQL